MNMHESSARHEFALVVKENPDEKEVLELRQHLRGFNQAHSNIKESLDLGIFLRDEQGQMVAGISGWLWGGGMEVDFLWVDEKLRGQGVGKRLLLTLEQTAQKRGCRQVSLNTFSFQAPEFYQKLGYSVIGVIDGFGEHFQKFFLRKHLP